MQHTSNQKTYMIFSEKSQKMRAINKLMDRLEELTESSENNYFYDIPSIWMRPENYSSTPVVKVSPVDFFLDKILEIQSISTDQKLLNKPRAKSDESVIYNMFVRYSAAFDHNMDGEIDTEPLDSGFRETGTFMKAIALLPYIHSLGVNTLYLLPITSIGVDGRKGNLGSPYAIKNPYKLDDNLSEPALGLDVETEFEALVEAAHLLGMNVVLEFVFRTASLDSDYAKEHPEWFYWIKNGIQDRMPGENEENKYGSPLFSDDDLDEIRQKIETDDTREDLIAPSEVFQKFFVDTPVAVECKDGKIIGMDKEKNKSKIPGAFADWPPDDIQPPWNDVTYLKLYDHKDFNYLAYNTVRMYDAKLAKEENKITDLWANIKNIIPHYQEKYAIDGVMIDMGHALPSELLQEILSEARKKNKKFFFWEENFIPSEKSKEAGYSSVVGYLIFDSQRPEKIRELIQAFEQDNFKIPFFLTPENHNTPRAASRFYGNYFSKFSWGLNNFLPGLPFIHSGFELNETQPVNTGLGFSPNELEHFPSDELPLFSAAAMNWTNKEEVSECISKISKLREKYIVQSENFNPKSIKSLENNCDKAVTFQRQFSGKQPIVFIGNMNAMKKQYFEVDLQTKDKYFVDILRDRIIPIINSNLIISLKPMEFTLGYTK
jgi:alpha amylase-like protein